MVPVKHIIVGFLISFIGSIPLGYLNIIGLDFFKNNDYVSVTQYLLGILCIEILVVAVTLKLASKIQVNPKLKKLITLFTLFLLVALAFAFYPKEITTQTNVSNPFQNLKNPFVAGLLLNGLNIAQVPFWFSWNFIVIQKSYITLSKTLIPFYFVGILLGTFLGMLGIIVSLTKAFGTYFTSNDFTIQNYLWIVFLALAFVHLFFFLIKTHKKVSM